MRDGTGEAGAGADAEAQAAEAEMEVLECDVAVVGGGPAGATAARFASIEGASTVLLERREVPGLPVQCGEFMPSLDICREMMPEAKDLDDLLGPALGCLSLRTTELRLFSPRGREYVIPFEGFSMDRDRFDAILVDRAREAGAAVHTSTAVRGMEMTGDGAILRARRLGGGGGWMEVRAKVVIGADGPHSIVRRELGVPAPKHISPCVQWTVEGEFQPVVEMWFGNVAPSGYGWVIPKKGGANIGLGVTGRRQAMSTLLRDFMTARGTGRASPVRRTGGHVPSTGPVPTTVSGRALLAGDAAGHVMATNGGGVPTALVGGRAAGTAAARHVRSGMPLHAYEAAWRLEMGAMLRNAARTRALASMAFGSEWRLDMSMRLMGLGGMRRAVTCKRPFILF